MCFQSQEEKQRNDLLNVLKDSNNNKEMALLRNISEMHFYC